MVRTIDDPDAPIAVRLTAARDLLDRASLTGKQELEVKISKFEEVEREIVMDIEPMELEAVVVEDAPRKALPAKTDDEIEEEMLARAYRSKSDQQIADEDAARRRHHRNVQRRKG